MIGITEKLAQTQRFVDETAAHFDRNPADIRVLAVGKRHGVDRLHEAYAAGQRDFAENFVTEAIEKINALRDCEDICWHFIGRLQSNKTRIVAEHFDWVHTIDRNRIAQRLNDQRPHHAAPLNVCVQVNIDGAASKAGVAPDAALSLCQFIDDLPRLRLRGLMCMPDAKPTESEQRAVFRATAELRDHLALQRRATLDTLSMGMSADMAAAVAEGATMLRIGTAIFGVRPTESTT